MELEERIERLEQEVAMLKSRVYNRRHPAAWAIAEYWLSSDDTPFCTPGDYYVTSMPGRDYYRIELPHCFRCNKHDTENDNLTPKDLWNRSGKWLDRAHLIDRARGGPDAPDNMVMLDRECHSIMPSFGYGRKQEAIDWVLREDDDSYLASIQKEIIFNIGLYRETEDMARQRLRGFSTLPRQYERELVVIHKVQQLH